MKEVLEGKDVIAAKEGTAFITIEGRNVQLFNAISIKAKIEKQKKEIKALGSRMQKNKATGAKGTGSLKVYEVTSEFKQIAYDYVKNGKDLYFDLMVTNEDPSTDYGRETKILRGCNFDDIEVANLDAEGDFLTQEMNFTFDDFDLPETFNTIK